MPTSSRPSTGDELATARTHAIEVERVSDDPPERISSWLSTVSEHEVRRLDQQVLLDLLAIETRPDAWQRVLDSAVDAIEQLVLQPAACRWRIRCSTPFIAAAQNGGPFADSAPGRPRSPAERTADEARRARSSASRATTRCSSDLVVLPRARPDA